AVARWRVRRCSGADCSNSRSTSISEMEVRHLIGMGILYPLRQRLFAPVHWREACTSHRTRSSSSSSGWTNYRGFFNLSMLLLVVSNGRVALENLIKYGVLVSPLQWVERAWADFSFTNCPNVALVLASNLVILTGIHHRETTAAWISARDVRSSLLSSHHLHPSHHSPSQSHSSTRATRCTPRAP
ncbi:hypothetical protein PMAYCL1PPCAC_33494, partial [Pristionchus mayeri]